MFPEEFWMDDRSKFLASDIFLKGTFGDWQFSGLSSRRSPRRIREEFPPDAGLPPGTAVRVRAHAEADARHGAQVQPRARERAAHVLRPTSRGRTAFGMHCAGCHAAQEQPEFSKPADHGYQAIGDFRVGLHMIPGHDILVGIEARRLDRAEHKVEL